MYYALDQIYIFFKYFAGIIFWLSIQNKKKINVNKQL